MSGEKWCRMHLICVLLLGYGFVAAVPTNAEPSTNPNRPLVFTFYQEYNAAPGGGTGMTSSDDQQLLQVWMDEWRKAGWNPRVLTIEDVEEYPHFYTVNRMMDDLPFKMYDRLCFLRWFAMAQIGGGWMVDYDAFPLEFLSHGLPNGGQLTVHEHSNSGGVPSVVSGSGFEFSRFAWALIENAVQHANEGHWSDMKALQDIYQQSQGRAYQMTKACLPALAILDGSGYSEYVCKRAAASSIIHFSHYSIDKGVTPAGSGAADRPKIARDWLVGWRNSCEVRSMESSVVPALPSVSNQPKSESDSRSTPQPEDPAPYEQRSEGHAPEIRGEHYLRSPSAPVPSRLDESQTQSISVQEKPEADGRVQAGTQNDVQESTLEPVLLGPSETRDPMSPRGSAPVVFTFYEATDPDHTGMSEADDQQLLQVWARSWQEMGWDTRILSMKVVQSHPEFDKFDSMMDGLPFKKFDRVCFYRWLAMGVVGGGWLSDFDTFPLDRVRWTGQGDPNFLPENGALVVHEFSKLGGVPSLVSGSQMEWYRMAKELVEESRNHAKEKHWSDMKGIQALHASSKGIAYFNVENVVMAAPLLAKDKELDHSLCMWLRTKYAVHFSSNALMQLDSFTDTREAARHRSEVGQDWIKRYKEACFETQNSKRRRLQQQDTRPIMYSFYTSIDGKKETGMTQEADNALLQLWKTEWHRAGWEPRVIGIETARQHPDFDRLNQILDGLSNLKVYDRYCFLRWLAMSVIGGGFMSDYDTFPLHMTADYGRLLPNGGTLTVHEHSKNGGVPSLVSGTASEFNRVGTALIENCRHHFSDAFWSDMMAMHDIYIVSQEQQSTPIYIMENKHVVPGQVVMKNRGIDERTCRRTNGKYAIHFSHYAIEFGSTEAFGVDGKSAEDRIAVSKAWLTAWRRECIISEAS